MVLFITILHLSLKSILFMIYKKQTMVLVSKKNILRTYERFLKKKKKKFLQRLCYLIKKKKKKNRM